MRVLEINKFFSVRGGSDTVFFETVKGLRDSGDDVIEFAMKAKDNEPSRYDKYFVSAVSLRDRRPAARLRAGARMFTSKEAAAKLGGLIHDTRPEVAHVHNAYRELSASTFLTLRKLRIPTVVTVHDMFPLVPNHNFLLGEKLAENKLGGQLYNCLRYKCVENSFTASLAGVLEAYYYRLRGIWKNIDQFICPSEFMRDKLLEYGFPKEKLSVVVNPCAVPDKPPPLGDKIVYLARLHAEKGIRVFLRALTELPPYPVVIGGDGPEAEWVDRFIRDHKLAHVKRLGWVNPPAREKLLREAKLLVSPAVFYDLCSLSVLEALARRRLVIASNRGGNPELVQDGVTGWLVKPEDPGALARAINRAMHAPAREAARITAAGAVLVKKNHDPQKYIAAVKAVYERVKYGGVDNRF